MTMRDESLSDEQRTIAESSASKIVVVAGAGSGKTYVVVKRIERILQSDGEVEKRVLAVSYTIKAADELRTRIETELGDLYRRVDADTIHGFAFRLLQQHGQVLGISLEPEVITRLEDRVELLRTWLLESGVSPPENLEDCLREIDLARARGQSAHLLEEWRQAMSSANIVDFGAMLDLAVDLLDDEWVATYLRRVYSDVVIDEAQNLTPKQYELLQKIIGKDASNGLRVMLVGDERQSIVSFAGADKDLMKVFEREYSATHFELTTNFRSAALIIDIGVRVSAELGQTTLSQEQVMYPAKGGVAFYEYADEHSEAKELAALLGEFLTNGLDTSTLAPGERSEIAPEQIAVIARSSSSLILLKDELERSDIRTASSSGEDDWLSGDFAKAVLDILTLKGSPHHQMAARHLYRVTDLLDESRQYAIVDFFEFIVGTRYESLAGLHVVDTVQTFVNTLDGIGANEDPDWKADLDQLQDAWRSFTDKTRQSEWSFSNFRAHITRIQRGDRLSPGVRLLTVHKAQGREFSVVVILGMNEGQFPDFRANSFEKRQEELRTFYVAVTRPSRQLILTRSRLRRTRFGSRLAEPSTFLQFISP